MIYEEIVSEFNYITPKTMRSSVLLESSVSPRLSEMDPKTADRLAVAIMDVEKATNSKSGFGCFVMTLRRLLTHLKDHAIEHPFSRRDLCVWAILEIIDTDVEFAELAKWMRHGSTVEEIILGEDESSMIGYLTSGKNGEQAWLRYQKLIRGKL